VSPGSRTGRFSRPTPACSTAQKAEQRATGQSGTADASRNFYFREIVVQREYVVSDIPTITRIRSTNDWSRFLGRGAMSSALCEDCSGQTSLAPTLTAAAIAYRAITPFGPSRPFGARMRQASQAAAGARPGGR
jgi:hypothetical protein